MRCARTNDRAAQVPINRSQSGGEDNSMNSKRQWFGAWAAVSALWVIYWLGLTLALGVEEIRDVVAEMGWPLLVGALYVSVPIGLYAIGVLAAWSIRGLKRNRP